MHIYYVSVLEQNWSWGAERFVNQELRRQGHETTTLDFREERWRLARHFLEVGDFDVFLLQRGDYFPLRLVEAVRRPRLYWASELVERCRDQDHLLESGLFDHIFVHSSRCRRIITSRGWVDEDRVSVMLNGFCSDLHVREEGTPTDIDVLFVGTLTARRKALLEELGAHFDLEVRQAFGRDMVELFNRARVVINLHAADHLDTETRVYEALGCGAFLVSEPLSEENPFVSGRHLVEAESGPAMVETIRHYLAHEDERRAVADAGHREAVANHSYAARAREIARVAGRYVSGSAAGRAAPGAVRGAAVDRVAVEDFQRVSLLHHAWRLTRTAVDRSRALLR